MSRYGTTERPAPGIPRISQVGPNLPALGAMPNSVSDVKAMGATGGTYVELCDIFIGAQPCTVTFIDDAGSESATGIPLNAFATYSIKVCNIGGIRFRSASNVATAVVVQTLLVIDGPPLETPTTLVGDMQVMTALRSPS